MSVLSISEMLNLKKLAAKYGYEIHVHDSCGGQYFEIESDIINEDFYKALQKLFSEHSMNIRFFDENRKSFSAK